jgi:2-polyprenyl-3-methyl-5-hydroxy-6-metoxy-1,4-benzoquinol methylase
VSHLDDSLRGRHYAKKQIYCKDWLISWSHRRRYQVGLKLTRQLSASRILDYGCGDGTFLGMLAADSTAPLSAVGAEMYMSLVEDCNARLGRAGLRLGLSDELNTPGHVNAYDLVICMEVLEHVQNVGSIVGSISAAARSIWRFPYQRACRNRSGADNQADDSDDRGLARARRLSRY